MKRRDLEKILRKLGYKFLRQGGSHEIWSNGEQNIAVPRHTEIVEGTARNIIRQCGG